MDDKPKENVNEKNESWSPGFYFGIISGTITTLGMIISLFLVSSSSKIALKVLASGIIGLALGDSFSDGLGHYYSNRGEGDSADKSRKIGIDTTFYKIIFTMSFLPIMVIFPSIIGLIISVIWTHLLVIYATLQIERNWDIIIKHLMILWSVIIMGYFGGHLTDYLF